MNQPTETHNTVDKIPQILRAARRALLSQRAISQEAIALTEKLALDVEGYEVVTSKRVRSRTPAARQSFKATVEAFTGDLLAASLNRQSEGFCSLSIREPTFKGTLGSFRSFRSLLAYLKHADHIDHVKGVCGLDDFAGGNYVRQRWAARLRARRTFIELARSYGVHPETIGEHFELDRSLFEPVVVKGEKHDKQVRPPKLSSPKEERRYQEVCHPVREINDFIECQEFNLPDAPVFQRVFNNADQRGFDYDQGGRLISKGPGAYQTMGKSLRKGITINGQATVEVDVSASQLTILHGLLDEPMRRQEAPYQVHGIPRAIAKKAVVITMGHGGKPKRWPSKFKAEYEEEYGESFPNNLTAGVVYDALCDLHPCLGRMAETGLNSYKLQYHESAAFLWAIIKLKRKNCIPSLPVHDSLIVPESAKQAAIQAIKAAYMAQANIEPRVVVK